MTDEANRALAHRLRRAVEETWDADRCTVEADAFIAEMRHRGWKHIPPVQEPPAKPGDYSRGAAEARAALAAAKPTPSPERTT